MKEEMQQALDIVPAEGEVAGVGGESLSRERGGHKNAVSAPAFKQ